MAWLLLLALQSAADLASDDPAVREGTQRAFRELGLDLDDAYALLGRPEEPERRRRLADLLSDLVRPYSAPPSPPRPRDPSGTIVEDAVEEDAEIQRKLRTIRVSFEAKAMPLTEAVDQVRETTGLNLHISGVENPELRRVVLDAQDATVRQALRRMVGPGLGLCVKDGVVLITTADQLRSQLKVELYEVRDLGVDGDALAGRIRREVRADSWCDADGLIVQSQDGLLVVRHRREVHAEIRVFLARLRGGAPPDPFVPERPEAQRRFRVVDAAAERDVFLLAERFRTAMGDLASAATSTDPELAARAMRANSVLVKAARRVVLPIDLIAGVRRVRAAFRDWDFDDEESLARAAFIPRVVEEARYWPSDDPGAPTIPDAVVLLASGCPVESFDEADELRFTVPDGARRPGVVRVRFRRGG